jgi:hypothetical protein
MSRLLKNILRRDAIRYDIKNKQTEGYFVSNAVVFITSNVPLNQILPSDEDFGLLDRFFKIPFNRVVIAPYSRMPKYLESELSAIANWALRVDPSVLKSQVHIGTSAQTLFHPLLQRK